MVHIHTCTRTLWSHATTSHKMGWELYHWLAIWNNIMQYFQRRDGIPAKHSWWFFWIRAGKFSGLNTFFPGSPCFYVIVMALWRKHTTCVHATFVKRPLLDRSSSCTHLRERLWYTTYYAQAHYRIFKFSGFLRKNSALWEGKWKLGIILGISGYLAGMRWARIKMGSYV